MNEDKIHIKLRNLRKARGLTVNTLAEKMGEDQQKVGRVERGFRNITVDYLMKLSRALEEPIESILVEVPKEEKREGVDGILLEEIIKFFDTEEELICRREHKASLIAKIYEVILKTPQAVQRQLLDAIFSIIKK